MKVKSFVVVLILAFATMGFMACDNGGTTTRIQHPFPLTVSEVLSQAIADGITEGATDAIGFSTTNRSFRFFEDGLVEVWTQGLGQGAVPSLSGYWVDRYDQIGNIIDVMANRNFSVTIGAGAAAVTTNVSAGERMYSFRYVLVGPETMVILQTIPGRLVINNNQGEGHPAAPGLNAVTVQTGEYSRLNPVPYLRQTF